jgi:hypothetical protein
VDDREGKEEEKVVAMVPFLVKRKENGERERDREGEETTRERKMNV